MEAEATDDIEMEGRNNQEAADQEGEEEETGFTDDQRRDDSILIIDGSNPLFTRADTEEDTSVGPGGSVPDARRDAGVMKRYMIHDKKQFLKDGLGVTVNKGDGPSSTKLYDELRTTRSSKTNNINGAEYRGKKILILGKDGKMEYSKSKISKPYVNEFKELLRKADKEHQKTPASVAEKKTGVDLTQETMNNIADNVSDKIGSKVKSKAEDIKANTELAENELREFRGILNVKGNSRAAKLEALKIESKNWKDKAKEEGETSKGKLYEAIAEVSDLKADEIRLRLNLKPETEEVIDMLEEEAEVNDMTKFEKFKQWCRSNLVGLSSVAISVAGVITTVVVATRAVVNKGGEGLKDLAKAVGKKIRELAKKLGEYLGPIVSALGTIISAIIKYLANILLFLGKNLWILFLAITYFIYNEYRDRRNRSKE